jgi:Uma2 family endonuclease
MMEMIATPPVKVRRPSRQKRWTQAEFRQLTEGPPFYELEDGMLIEMARPKGRHQEIIGHLFATITPFLRQNKLGKVWPEVEVDLTPTRTYVPDLSYLTAEHLTQFEGDIAIQGPPDLVVEVLSSSTAKRDKFHKLMAYQKASVPYYWLIDEELIIIEYKNTPEGYLLTQVVVPPDPFTPQLFPGLTINLAELMGELELVQVEEDQHE